MSNKKKLVIFIPSIEDGGVEKNLYLVTNYLSKYIKNIRLITFDKKKKNKFNTKIKFICPNLQITVNMKDHLNIINV